MIIPYPSVADLLVELHALGIVLQVSGDDAIRFRPRHAMTPDHLEGVRTHKAELLVMLVIEQGRALGGEDLAQALQESWEERIAICTTDGELPLGEAERVALEQIRCIVKDHT